MTVTANSAVPALPDPSLAVAVQRTSVFAVTEGAVKVLFAKLPPFVHVTVVPGVTAALSVTVNVEAAVFPDATVKVAGLNARVGAVVSGAIETVRTAVEEFPAASLAVAVHSLVVAVVTIGAVKVFPENVPPFVQFVVGPDVIPTLSDADKVEAAEPPPTAESDVGLKETFGAVVSATGGGGGGVTVPLDDDHPPPQAVRPKAKTVIALT